MLKMSTYGARIFLLLIFGLNITEQKRVCNYNELVKLCIAQCLNLTTNGASQRCNMHEKSGEALDEYTSSCPDCQTLNFNSALAKTMKSINSAVAGTLKKMCNKTFYYGTALPAEFENVAYSCNLLTRPSTQWVPETTDEIKCVILNLPEEYRKASTLWVIAQRNYCKKKFSICGLPDNSYVPLNSSILPWNPNNGTSNSTSAKNFNCVRINYKLANKTAFQSLQFQEVSCKSTTAIGICQIIN
ncbi:Hypothetical predicted protein [Cloeon dipterum]|uniref:C-type lectin domain-containing protein n=1 Tax=Cloeon dipterum TaxID=197152 RepID=A0A8S1C6H9_9INSE|nr:Hypothetical predicted protein [Cloeon dipterum]